MSSFVFETVIEMAVNLEACDWTMSGTTQDHRYYLPIRRLENTGNTNIGRIVSEANDMEDDCPKNRKFVNRPKLCRLTDTRQ
jgi:hypothetical protein